MRRQPRQFLMGRNYPGWHGVMMTLHQLRQGRQDNHAANHNRCLGQSYGIARLTYFEVAQFQISLIDLEHVNARVEVGRELQQHTWRLTCTL
jgi:hypothetical protein